MVRRRGIVLSVVSSIALTSCSPQGDSATTLEEDLDAIAEFNQRYLQSINDGDIETLSSLTTDRHMMILPNRLPIIGKAANDAANARVFELFDIDETWTPEETVVAGAWAYQRGTFSVTATPKAGGDTRVTTGHFLRIYERQNDGSWRMTRDMFNSDSSSDGLQ